MPNPIAKRLTFPCPVTAHPVISLPIIATIIKKVAMINPSLFSGTIGFNTPKSTFAPTLTKKTGTKISAMGTTC